MNGEHKDFKERIIDLAKDRAELIATIKSIYDAGNRPEEYEPNHDGAARFRMLGIAKEALKKFAPGALPREQTSGEINAHLQEIGALGRKEMP